MKNIESSNGLCKYCEGTGIIGAESNPGRSYCPACNPRAYNKDVINSKAIKPEKINNTSSLRTYLRANMFDGQEDGMITMNATSLLDEICQNVALWMIHATESEKFMDNYYGIDLFMKLKPNSILRFVD